MNWKLGAFALSLGVAFVSLQGCASNTSPGDEADDEEAAASEADLSANAKKLVGAFQDAGGSVRPPTFQGIVFESNGTFFADVDTGIRCVRAPCPSGARLEGKFTATANYVRLTAKTPGGEGAAFYGRYRYTLTPAGKKLHLSRADFGATWSNDLASKPSYCQQPKDCEGQNIITPMCVGSWTCGNASANQCGWKCGVPVSPIWPADASKLVAESPGGGFTPPPPPGSTCAIGHSKYSLDIATKQITWETCDWTGDGSPMHLKTGVTTATAAEMVKINAAMNAVKLTGRDNMCGADKPLLTIKVTSPAGEKTYTDSFYSCWGDGRTFVDNIDGVFGALRNAVQ